MFAWLGTAVVRFRIAILAAWVVLFASLSWTAPDWNRIAEDGEFEFLPADSPTRQAERLFQNAFPDEESDSSIVVVLWREQQPLTADDRSFITDTLQPRLQQVSTGSRSSPALDQQQASSSQSLILNVRTFNDSTVGEMFLSEDERAALVVVDLATDFLSERNLQIVSAVEKSIAELRQQAAIPEGLQMALTGSAVVGRDQLQAKSKSANAIHTWAIWVVIALLLVVYRAPLIVVVPLLTLYLAVDITLDIVAHLAGAGFFGVFSGLEIYTTVIVYGAGVDYSLFLISRFKEELDRGRDSRSAASESVERVGTAILGSAGTEIFGIGMLVFASFEKFQQAGISIALGFVVMLAASLTFAPAMLCLLGRSAFWPWRTATAARTDDREEVSQRVEKGAGAFRSMWGAVGRLLERRPATVLLVTVALMAPFAIVAVRDYNDLNYGIVSELPDDSTSVRGMDVLQEYFPAGLTGSVTVLIQDGSADFGSPAGRDAVRTWTQRLSDQRSELEIAEMRTLSHPRGSQSTDEATTGGSGQSRMQQLMARRVERDAARDYFVSSNEELGGSVVRATVFLESDPFSRSTIQALDNLRTAMRDALPSDLADAELHLLGPTANLYDLRTVAQQDRTRIQILVTSCVLLVLILVLRRVAVSIYLIVTVLFGYLVALGATFLVFQQLSPNDFSGLDWTVPIFLFTVLIAVGADYNIFLITRVDEEQKHHGPVRGVGVALRKTGGIISGCGVIMAGTFLSLTVGGSLEGMQQLGSALALGVLIDTFIVRPVLVPAYLVLVNNGQLGPLSRWMGGSPQDVQS